MYQVYVDESCQNAHDFLVLGCIVIDSNKIETLKDALNAVRDRHATYGEVKWQKVSRNKFDFYKEFVDVYFDLATSDVLHFHTLVVECKTMDDSQFNGGNSDIGFNKLIYQLLLHRCGRRYQGPLYVFLDDRPSPTPADAIRPILNAAMAKAGDSSAPFKRVTFVQSHASLAVQLVDVLIGAIGYRKNGKHNASGAAPHKIALANHIARRCIQLEAKPHYASAVKFTYWPFKYRKKVVSVA
jgi:hypothetical protein